MKKFEISTGDEFTVEFLKNSASGRPTGRIYGVVCFLDKDDRTFVAPGSSWIVRVSKVGATFLYVLPLVEVKTAKENNQRLMSKINCIKTKKSSGKLLLEEFQDILKNNSVDS